MQANPGLRLGVKQCNNIFSTPAYWNGSIYLHWHGDVLRAVRWNADPERSSDFVSVPSLPLAVLP